MLNIPCYIGESAKILASHECLIKPVLVKANYVLLSDGRVKIYVLHRDMSTVCVVSALEWRNRPKDSAKSMEGARWALRNCGWHC